MLKIVRCPESEQLELVECVDTPLGNLIHRCTRFRPVCSLSCTRSCATALDRETRSRAPIREPDGEIALDPSEFELEETR